MSLIRKPDVDVFRDSGTVVAVRGAKELVQEGAVGLARTITRLWLTLVIVAFAAAGLGAAVAAGPAFGIGIGLAVVSGVIWALRQVWRTPTRPDALAEGAIAPGAGISVPLPEHLREPGVEDGFHVDYWPRAFVNQATMLFLGGFVFMRLDHVGFGLLAISGFLMVMRSVLLVSLMFGGRTCVTATAECLTVHSLIGDNSIAWTDISAVTTRTVTRRSWWTVLTTGSRHHIAVSRYFPVGTRDLLIPYKLLGLNDEAGAELMRRIRQRATVAQAYVPPAAVSRPFQRTGAAEPRVYGLRAQPSAARPSALHPASPFHAAPEFHAAPPRPMPAADPEPLQPAHDGFDPDAIMARYLARRNAAPASPPDLASVPLPARQLRTFGRKRA
jgi:hypothetical protein